MITVEITALQLQIGMANVLRAYQRFCLCAILVLEYHLHSQPPQEIEMSQNSKDSKEGKSQPAKDTAGTGSKKTDKGAADKKSASSTGSNKTGEKKTTP